MARCALAAVLFAAVAVAAADEKKMDKALKDIQGEYTVKSMSKDGMPAPKEVLDEVHGITIKGDLFTVKMKDKEEKAKIKLDGTKKPAHIDLTPQTGPDKDKTFPGIYKLEKGELTILFVEKGDRPKEFKKDEMDQMTIVLAKKKTDDK